MNSVRAAQNSDTDSRELRVFISSTFRDMQPEREELLKRVGPRLRQLCEQRGVAWNFVDLRWGITEEESRADQVVSLCLAEIDNCSPYFIGLLADRYGWVPAELPPELVGQQPWVREYTDRSVTELEIVAGALRNPAPGCAFFYFCHQRSKDTDPRLLALKERIRLSGLEVRDYDSAHQLGELVLADLTGLIDWLYPPTEETNLRERENRTQRAYAAPLTRMHIPRQNYFDRLDDHAAGDGPPLVLTGESGSGKSALMATWARLWREHHPAQLVIEHYVGASADSTNWEQMLVRIMSELKQHFDIPHDLPEDLRDIRSKFADFLNIATARGRWLLLVDGLDKLEDRDNAPDLLWLPDAMLLPALRLVLSTLPGRPLEAVRARKWPTIELERLSREERERFTVEYLAFYSKRLDTSRTERIAHARQTGNPLFLQTLLEELRLFGEHEQLEERIGHYLDAHDLKDLYDRILQRYEQDYEADRPGLVRHVMTAIWASRQGLYESELLDLAGSNDKPLPQAIWSPLRAGTGANLLLRSGLIGFRQTALREAIKQRYLASAELQQAAHLELANYFQARPVSARKAEELPWQLRQARRFEFLADTLSDLTLLAASVATRTFDACQFWDDVEKHTSRTRVDTYGEVIGHPERHLDSVDDVALLLLNGDHYEAATKMLAAAERHAEVIKRPDLQARFLWGQYKVIQRSIVRLELRRVIRPGNVLEKQIAVLRELHDPQQLIRSLSALADETYDDVGAMANDPIRRDLVIKGREYDREVERIARDAGLPGEVAVALAKQATTYLWLGDWHAALHLHALAFTRAVASQEKGALLFTAWQHADLNAAMGGDKAKLKQCLKLSTELSRQIDTARDYAHKVKSAAKTLLQAATEQADYDEVIELRREARRMMALTGDSDPWLNDTRDLIIEFWKRERMSIPELSESFATFEGPCRGWWTVSAELVMGCRDDVDQCLKTLSGAGCIEKIEIEFYDALHYLVNPIRRAGAKERERLLAAIGTGMTQAPADRTHTAQAELFQAINALHVALNGIAPLNHELASKYHPYGVVGASSVQGVAGWLSALLPMWNALAHSVSSRSLDEHGIYPGGWEEWGEAGRAHLQQKLKELREFYGRAAEAGACIIVGPSGAQLLEMQTMWAAEARQPQQNVSSGGYWFDGKTGGDREIDCTCRRCGFEFTFDPFQGERPPAKCPTCGTS